MTEAVPHPIVRPTTSALLDEIENSTAAELVLAVRYHTAPPGPTFIPSLDDILLDARPHPGGSALQRGDLIEVVGPSGSGKTAFLIFTLMTTLLPASVSVRGTRVELGGRGSTAIFIHPNTHASIVPRLRAVMASHLRSLAPALTAAGVAATISASLARLTVVRVRPRWSNWALALARVLAGLDGAPALLVLDGLVDGYWPERWAEENSRRRDRARAPGVRGTEDVGFRDVWDALVRVRKELGAVVFVSVQGLWPAKTPPFFTPHVAGFPDSFAESGAGAGGPPAPWPTTAQMTLPGRRRPLQMPAETTLGDALRARAPAHYHAYEGIARVPGGRGAAGDLAGARWAFDMGADGLYPGYSEVV
ncbi:hypothetical protein Q5752_003676 [Cryptotrichosporon argae]